MTTMIQSNNNMVRLMGVLFLLFGHQIVTVVSFSSSFSQQPTKRKGTRFVSFMVSQQQQQQQRKNEQSSLQDEVNDMMNQHLDDQNTVVTLEIPDTQQTVTLIGTAHLSKKSNQQVQRLIETLQPNVVMVELDPTRLPRIGIDNVDAIQQLNVKTVKDIVLPDTTTTQNNEPNPLEFLWKPVLASQTIIVEAFTRVARAMLTGMYNDMSSQMDKENPPQGGGEFLVAIRAAELCEACHTLVLGDRSSLETIRRAATLAMESGDPLGVLNRLQQANAKEMQSLEDRVRHQMLQEYRQKDNNRDLSADDLDRSELQVKVMEYLKQDAQFRDRLFAQLEQEVPEFTQAFLKERDYIMSQAIGRELSSSSSSSPTSVVQRVVGVVGLAHVPGIKSHLEAQFMLLPKDTNTTTTTTTNLLES